jgi:hypothetical protein
MPIMNNDCTRGLQSSCHCRGGVSNLAALFWWSCDLLRVISNNSDVRDNKLSVSQNRIKHRIIGRRRDTLIVPQMVL